MDYADPAQAIDRIHCGTSIANNQYERSSQKGMLIFCRPLDTCVAGISEHAEEGELC